MQSSASVNATNNIGQTPLDLANGGYLNQEWKLSLFSTALNQPLVAWNSRENSPRLLLCRSFTENHRESPLLSTIVPKWLKFITMNLDDDGHLFTLPTSLQFDLWQRKVLKYNCSPHENS